MQCVGIGAMTRMLGETAEAARGSIATPPPLHDQPDGALSEEEVVGEGDAWEPYAHTIKNEETEKGTKEFALNQALSSAGWSMERVMSMLPGPAIDQLVEHMPLASYYVGGDPDTVARTRKRLKTTEGYDFNSAQPARHWRNVTSIPPIDIDNSTVRDPWQNKASDGVALSSGYGRSAVHGAGAVPNAITWIEAVGQLEPMLNREEGAVHAFEMHARITAFLIQYMRARSMRVQHVQSAEIDPEPVSASQQRKAPEW